MSGAQPVEIEVQTLHAWLHDAARPAPLLLDVREEWEYEFCALEQAQLMPLAQVPAGCAGLDRSREVVCICHHGLRSAQAAAYLVQQGFGKVYNLAGGMDAWARRVDPSVPTY